MKKIKVLFCLVIGLIAFLTFTPTAFAAVAITNFENLNISIKNYNRDDKVSVILTNDSSFETESLYSIRKFSIKNGKTIEAFHEDTGLWITGGVYNDLAENINIKENGDKYQVELELSHESVLAVNTDFQVSVFINDEKIIDKATASFSNKSNCDIESCAYYSNFEIDIKNRTVKNIEPNTIIKKIICVVGILIIGVVIFLLKKKSKKNS